MGTEHTGFPDKRSDPAGVAGGLRILFYRTGGHGGYFYGEYARGQCSGSGRHQFADGRFRGPDHRILRIE